MFELLTISKGAYNYLSNIIIPELIRSIKCITIELDNEKRKDLLKTLNNEMKLSKKIDKLLKTLVTETVTGSLNKSPNASVPNVEERHEPNKIDKTSLIHNEVKTAVQTSLVHTNVETVALNEAPKMFLVDTHDKTIVPNETTETSFIQIEEEIPTSNMGPRTSLIQNEVKNDVPDGAAKTSLVHTPAKTIETDKATKTSYVRIGVQTVVPYEAPKTSLVHAHTLIIVQRNAPETLWIHNEVKTAVEKKSLKASFKRSNEQGDVPNKAAKTHLIDIEPEMVVTKETTKTGLIDSNTNKLLNNIPRTSFIKNNATSKLTVPPQKYYLPIASILSEPKKEQTKKHKINTKKPSVINIYTKASPTTMLFPPKKSKQENRTDSIQRILPDDHELRPFQQKNLNHLLNTQILPIRKVNPLLAEQKEKVLITDQQDNEQTSEEKGTRKKSQLFTQNQQLLENTSTTNSTAVQNEKMTEKPHQKSEKNAINYPPKSISILNSSSELKHKKVILNIQEGETSSQLPNEQNSPLIGTSTSEPETPDESDYDGDASIPPNDNELYVVDSNILKTRKKLLRTLKNEKKLGKDIDKLLKTLATERVTDLLNKTPKAFFIPSDEERHEPNNTIKTSLKHNDVNTAVPNKEPLTFIETSFIHSKEERPIKNEDPQTFLIHNKVKTIVPNEDPKTSFVHAHTIIVQRNAPQTSLIHNSVKTAIANKKVQESRRGSSKHRNVEAVAHNKTSKACDAEEDVPSKAHKTLLLHGHVQSITPKENNKTGLVNGNVNSDATSRKTVDVSPQKYYLPIASILSVSKLHPKNLKNNTRKPSFINIDAMNSPINVLLSAKKSKQEMVDKGMDPIQRILPDDNELRPFQQKNLYHIFNTQILPTRKVSPLFAEQRQKVFVAVQQKTQRDDEQTRGNKGTPKETQTLTENQQVHENTSTANSTALRIQQTTGKSHQQPEKYQPQQKQCSITINYPPKTILSVKSSSQLKGKNVKLNIQEEETSSQPPNLQNSPFIGTSKSKAETSKLVSSTILPALSPLKKIVPNASKEGELIVIKVPDESDFDGDAFIPPIANKRFVVDTNIIEIDALDDDTESKDAQFTARDDIKQYLQKIGEVSETATFNSKTDKFTDTDESITETTNVRSNELYSMCESPTKQASESNLQVSDLSITFNDLVDDSVDALKQFCSPSQLELLDPDFAEFAEVLEAYRACDKFDETLKQPMSNRKVFEFVEESDLSKGSSTNSTKQRKPKDTRNEKPLKFSDQDDFIE